MKRREVIGAMISCTALSGCAQTTTVLGGLSTQDVGDSVTYDGVTIAVLDWDSAPRAVSYISNDQARQTKPPEGATLLLVKIRSEIQGDQPRQHPSYRHQRMLDSEIEILYNGEDTEGVYLFSTRGYFRANGREYDSYEAQLNENPGEMYPPHTIEGWVGTNVSSNFDSSKVVIEISWNGQTQRWRLAGERPTHTDTPIVIEI